MSLSLLCTCIAVPFSSIRIAGVLQRLAATYFVVAITELCAGEVYKRKKVREKDYRVGGSYQW